MAPDAPCAAPVRRPPPVLPLGAVGRSLGADHCPSGSNAPSPPRSPRYSKRSTSYHLKCGVNDRGRGDPSVVNLNSASGRSVREYSEHDRDRDEKGGCERSSGGDSHEDTRGEQRLRRAGTVLPDVLAMLSRSPLYTPSRSPTLPNGRRGWVASGVRERGRGQTGLITLASVKRARMPPGLQSR
jgi:hypothetical protein